MPPLPPVALVDTCTLDLPRDCACVATLGQTINDKPHFFSGKCKNLQFILNKLIHLENCYKNHCFSQETDKTLVYLRATTASLGHLHYQHACHP